MEALEQRSPIRGRFGSGTERAAREAQLDELGLSEEQRRRLAESNREGAERSDTGLLAMENLIKYGTGGLVRDARVAHDLAVAVASFAYNASLSRLRPLTVEDAGEV